jgi:hypothetical protein
MFKGKFVVLTVIAAALLSWQIMPASVDTANSGIVDPCSSTAFTACPAPAGGCLYVCPQGDGPTLAQTGCVISVCAKDQTGTPIAGIPAADFWVEGCTGAMVLCGGSGSSNADSASSTNGCTTMSGAVAAGGCDIGLIVVIQGVIVKDQATACTTDKCLPIAIRSPDINGDLIVDIIDLSLFAVGYTSPPKPYDPCLDFNCDGLVDIIDFSIFAQHYLHVC